MPTWIDEQAALARHDDMRRRAAQLANARIVIAARGPTVRFYAPVLARLGRQLAIWGLSLERRYHPVLEPSIACNCGRVQSR